MRFLSGARWGALTTVANIGAQVALAEGVVDYLFIKPRDYLVQLGHRGQALVRSTLTTEFVVPELIAGLTTRELAWTRQ